MQSLLSTFSLMGTLLHHAACKAARLGVLLLMAWGVIGLPAQAGEGWIFLDHLLGKLTPSVDTRLPPSADETAAHIATLLKSQHYEAALKMAEVAYEESQERNIQFLYLMGEAYRGLGQYTQAETIFRQLTARHPEIPQPWNSLALVQSHHHAWNDAVYSLQMALLANPNFKAAAENLKRIEPKAQAMQAP